ncbi:MAG TPA: hypothetical protein VJP02_15675 [Candidatus Sulfotelmatobacter sp.]|nr:hypothetical protein [Candidatus Sulfotelmatobacter sp.]
MRRLVVLFDQLSQTQRARKPGRSRANNQDVGSQHFAFFRQAATPIPPAPRSRLHRFRVTLHLLQFFYVAFFMHGLAIVVTLA